MNIHDPLLLKVFTQLRQAGLPLGFNEYEVLLYALQGGFGMSETTDLLRLCKILWAKSLEDEHLIEVCFEQIVSQNRSSQKPPSISSLNSAQSQENLPATYEQETAQSSMSSFSTTIQESEEADVVSPSLAPELTLQIEDEIQAVKAVSQTVSDRPVERPHNYFFPAEEYLPITRRQMKQSWRHLRRPIRKGPPIIVDVEGTIEHVGRQGIFLEPLLMPERVNVAGLILLIDQGGSMVPFHIVSRRLADTALKGGKLGRTNIYYFHNVPGSYLYHDPTHLEAKPLEQFLEEVQENRASVIIISDAGAARGHLNPDRIKMTETFLDQLKQTVRYVAWLNPMPRSRWHETTADIIGQMIPMFEIDRKGLDAAIRVLRGYPIPSLY